MQNNLEQINTEIRRVEEKYNVVFKAIPSTALVVLDKDTGRETGGERLASISEEIIAIQKQFDVVFQASTAISVNKINAENTEEPQEEVTEAKEESKTKGKK